MKYLKGKVGSSAVVLLVALILVAGAIIFVASQNHRKTAPDERDYSVDASVVNMIPTDEEVKTNIAEVNNARELAEKAAAERSARRKAAMEKIKNDTLKE